MARKSASILIGTCFLLSSLGAQRLVICYPEEDSSPFQTGTSQATAAKPGIAVELVLQAAKDAGIEVTIVRRPNLRVLQSLKEGIIDAAFSYSFSADRLAMAAYPTKDGKIDPSRRVSRLTYSFYVRAGSAITWDGKSITGLKLPVGANHGYSVINDLNQATIPTVEAMDSEANLVKLNLGRIDAYAGQDIVIDPLVRSKGLEGRIVKLQPPFIVKDYYLLFSHQYYNAQRATAERLWGKLGELREIMLPQLAKKYTQ